MSKIALVRHGESQWNKKGLWTGWQDIPLSEKGKKEAALAAKLLKDIDFHHFFTSDLVRAIETLEIIKKELDKSHLPVIKHHALKERNYGEFTGKNKWKIKKQVGEIRFLQIRRGWDYPIKEGETLKDVHSRVVPYFENSILPHLKSGKNVLLVAHGNSIRALVKYLEGVSDEGITEIELETGEIVIYELDKKGLLVNKERRREKK